MGSLAARNAEKTWGKMSLHNSVDDKYHLLSYSRMRKTAGASSSRLISFWPVSSNSAPSPKRAAFDKTS